MKALFIILMVFLYAVPAAMAVEAHFDFGGDGGSDGAVGYVLQWGMSASAYTKQAEIAKTACVAGTDTNGPYDCNISIANSEFVIDTRYYFTLYAWQWSFDGTTKIPSGPGNPTAEFVMRSGGGGTPGTAPSPPVGLGVYPTAH